MNTGASALTCTNILGIKRGRTTIEWLGDYSTSPDQNGYHVGSCLSKFHFGLSPINADLSGELARLDHA